MFRRSLFRNPTTTSTSSVVSPSSATSSILFHQLMMKSSKTTTNNKKSKQAKNKSTTTTKKKIETEQDVRAPVVLSSSSSSPNTISNNSNAHLLDDIDYLAAHADLRRSHLLSGTLEEVLQKQDRHTSDFHSRSKFLRLFREELIDIQSFHEFMNAAKFLALESNSGEVAQVRMGMRALRHRVWVDSLEQVLIRNNNSNINGNSGTNQEHETDSVLPEKRTRNQARIARRQSFEQLDERTLAAIKMRVLKKQIDGDTFDDIIFWWKQCGLLSMTQTSILELTRFISASNSPLIRLVNALTLLATPPYGSELGRYEIITSLRRVNTSTAVPSTSDDNKNDNNVGGVFYGLNKMSKKERTSILKNKGVEEVAEAAEQSRLAAYSLLKSKEGIDRQAEIANRYTQIKQELLNTIQDIRNTAWKFKSINDDNGEQQQAIMRQKILDVVAAGCIVARETHLLPPKDTEQILTAIQHCLSGCVGESKLTCFAPNDFLDRKTSILPFCFSNIVKVREREQLWADRTLAIMFSWVQAHAQNYCIGRNGSQAEGDRAVRFSLTVAAKQGIPLSILAKSPLLTNVMSFFGLVSCLSVPILRPLANMIPTEILRDLFYRQQGILLLTPQTTNTSNNSTASSDNDKNKQHQQQQPSTKKQQRLLLLQQQQQALLQQQQQSLNRNSDKRGSGNNNNTIINQPMDIAQLVTILPFICLYLPQIAPEVAGALAKKTSSSGTSTDNTNSSTESSSSSSNNTSTANSTSSGGISAVPAIITLMADRFRQLCNGKWLEVNIETRENVSGILLADLVDPSMTTQAAHLLSQHPDKLPAFFVSLFNWGISDLTLSRLRLIVERVPGEVRTDFYRELKDYTRDLQLMADKCALFLANSNVRQGAHAERASIIIRLLTDQLVLGAIESIEEFSESSDVWTLFVSVYKLVSNSCLSSDAAQKAAATLGVFFRDEHRLKSAIDGKIENLLFLLNCGFGDENNLKNLSTTTLSNNKGLFSLSIKQQLAPPLLNIVVEKIQSEAQEKHDYEQQMEIYKHELEQYNQSQELIQQQQKASSTKKSNKSSSKNKKNKKNKNAVEEEEQGISTFSFATIEKPFEPTIPTSMSSPESRWSQHTASLFLSFVRGQFISDVKKIPTELQVPDANASDNFNNIEQENNQTIIKKQLQWLQVLTESCSSISSSAASFSTLSNSSETSSSGNNNKKKSTSTTSTTTASNNSNNHLLDPEELSPFAQWLRKQAEPFVESLLQQREDLTNDQFVSLFLCMDKLGLTFNHTLEAIADQTYRLVGSDNKFNSNIDAFSNLQTDTNIKDDVDVLQQKKTIPTFSEQQSRLCFVAAIANSAVKTYPDQIVDDAMKVFEALQHIEYLSFDQMVDLGIITGTMLERRVASHNNNNNSAEEKFGGDFPGSNHTQGTALFNTIVRKVAASAVYATHNQISAATTNNTNNNSNGKSSSTSSGDIISSSSSSTAVSSTTSSTSSKLKTPLTPSQAIGLLKALYLTGVPHNSIFAQLLAVVDQARRSAPLLEADVLSLCTIVSDMSKKANEGRLSSASTINLDGARAAARDSLAQLLRFLVRSRTLDRVDQFGRLLESVVTVLATTIEVHTMQELASSALSRAKRGQLTNADVETILRIITSRLSVAPQLGQQLARTTLPEMRSFVATQGFPSMSARSCCTSLYLLHQCYPLQNCTTEDLMMVIDAFEARMLNTGKQLDIPSIAMLCIVYRDIHRSSAVLQHVLNHLTRLEASTMSLRHVRDIASSIVGLKSSHRDAMSFLERRAMSLFEAPSSNMYQDPHFVEPLLFTEILSIFAPNRFTALGDAAAKVLTAEYIQNHLTALQAASVAHSIALLGVRNAAIYHRLMNVVYAERRGSLLSNPNLIANLNFVFEMLNREVHPALYDLVAPKRSSLADHRML